MQWAHLEKTRLGRAYLSGTRLWDVHLDGARLWGAHLIGADFTRATFTESQLDNVDLSGSIIPDWEQVQTAFYNDKTRFPANIENSKGSAPAPVT
jgi:uncharacterized protein YjbI with pentapeptide repeats